MNVFIWSSKKRTLRCQNQCCFTHKNMERNRRQITRGRSSSKLEDVLFHTLPLPKHTNTPYTLLLNYLHIKKTQDNSSTEVTTEHNWLRQFARASIKCCLPASSFDPPSPLTRTEGTRVPSGWSAVSDSSDDVTPSLFRLMTTGLV